MGGDALRLGLVLVHRFVGEVQGELVPAVGAGDFPDVQDALIDDDIRAAAGAGDLEEIVVVQGGAAAAAAILVLAMSFPSLEVSWSRSSPSASPFR